MSKFNAKDQITSHYLDILINHSVIVPSKIAINNYTVKRKKNSFSNNLQRIGH